jgi:hypothetical protein
MTVGAVISGGVHVDHARPGVNAGAGSGRSRRRLRTTRGKIVNRESHLVVIQIDLDHLVDRLTEEGEFAFQPALPARAT